MTPRVRRHCRAYRFDPETLEELCQRIWIDLARCLKTYRYDPSRRFRSWLGRLCRSRAIDLYRQRKAESLKRSDGAPADLFDPDGLPAEFEPDDDSGSDRPALLIQAEAIQAAVRARVDDRTWRVFWAIAVEGDAVRETAEAEGLSYAAAFASQKRVRRMLREEAARMNPGGAAPCP